MNRRDIIIGIIVLAIIAGAIYFAQQETPSDSDSTPVPTSRIETDLEEQFQRELPEGAERVELENEDGRAVVTREVDEEGPDMLTVLADLPEATGGSYYEVWLRQGEEDDDEFVQTSAGRLTVAKGGFVLDYQTNADLSTYDSVVVSKETVADSVPDEVVFEESF